MSLLHNAMFARRTQWELGQNRITQSLEAFKLKGIAISNLTESNPTRCGFSFSADSRYQALSKKENLLYEPQSQGLLSAREAVLKYYAHKGIHLSPSRMILTSSTSEGYSFLFRLLADYDDSILFPVPSYPLFNFLVDLNDLHMENYSLIYQDGWRIDLKSLKDKLTEKLKAVVVVSPNNPTGSVVSIEEWRAVQEMCSKKDVALICDCVFEDYIYQGSSDASCLYQNGKALTFLLGGLSKTLGLPQMKLSWIIVNGPQDKVHEALKRLEVIADTYLSVNTPVQNALSDWFERQPQIRQEIMSRILNNRATLHHALKDSPSLQYLKAEGGWYAVLKVTETMGEEALVLKLLDETHTLTHPGYFFDFSDGAHLVISLLCKEDEFRKGVRCIKELVN